MTKRPILLWDEFIYGGHLLSLGASSIIYTTARLLNSNVDWRVLLLGYLSAQSMYLFNRYKEFEQDYSTNVDRTQHIEKSVKHYPYIIFLMMAVFYSLLIVYHKYSALFFSFVPIAIGLGYSIFLKDLTKKIPGFKTIIVALGWALYSIFYLVYSDLSASSLLVFSTFLFIFFRWIINTSFFDVKDMPADEEKRLITLPLALGKSNFFRFLQVMNILSALPIIIGFYIGGLPTIGLLLTLTIPYACLYFYIAQNSPNSKLPYYVLADGEFALWSVILLVGGRLL